MCATREADSGVPKLTLASAGVRMHTGTAEEPAESLEDAAEESREWAAAFAQLHNASKPEPDPLPDVTDAKRNLAAQVARLSQVRVFLVCWELHSSIRTSCCIVLHRSIVGCLQGLACRIEKCMPVQAQPGRLPPLIQSSLSADLQQRLQGYCQAAGVSVA